MSPEESLRKSTRSFKLAIGACVISAVLFTLTVGGGILLSAKSATDSCEAAAQSNVILRELIVHIEHRSIASIREGVTKDITPAEVRAFYGPTLRRIDAVSC